MFSPLIIADRLTKIRKKIGIPLVEHPIDECAKVYEHFRKITQTDGNRSWYQRPNEQESDFQFVPWEQEWIRNEMYVCAISFPYWFYRYFFLKTKENQIRRPDVQVAQSAFLDLLAELDEKQLPILVLLLKARQLGLSTLVEAIILWISMFRRGSHCVIASAEEDKSIAMSSMVQTGLDNLPLWMLPEITGDSKKSGWKFGNNESDILIEHGAQTKGISRGSTPIAAHLCLRGDALIDVGNGDLKRIDKIEIGDSVMTHTGQRASVSAISKTSAKSRRIVEIRTWLNKERVALTADHKVFTREGWKAAGDLTMFDWIGTPVRKLTGRLTSLLTPDVRDKLGRTKRGKCSPMLFPLNRETGFAVGYFVAEGSLGFNPLGACKIVFYLHQAEKSYADRADAALREFCTTSSYRHVPNAKTAMLQVYGTSLARFFYAHFGATDEKRIPEWVFDTNAEFIEGIVAGYFCGDGSKTGRKMVQATSTRSRLLYQIRHLMALLGIGWAGITTEEAFIDQRGWDNKKSWTLTASGVVADRLSALMGVEFVPAKEIRDQVFKHELTEDFVWTRVRSVEDTEADFVWDIEVDHPDHDFETVLGVVANSEIAYYANPYETIESSLLRAMHENKRTFLVLESTAKRKDDWLHNTWKENREGERTKTNKFTCFFLPWYVGRDKYPTQDWLRNHPIPEDWQPLSATLEQAAKAALYVSLTPRLQKYMPPDWIMPPEQMWFWEFERRNAQKDRKAWRSFLAEMAADEKTCFTNMKESVYSAEVLDRVRATVDAATYKDYAFTGDGIPKKFQLQSYQSPQRRKTIDWITIEGRPRRWELVPLRETPDDPAHNFYLRVWEEPRRGFEYALGIDIGGGIGRDNSTIEVVRHNPETGVDKQVAQLYTNWVGSSELPPFALCLGVWYGTFMQPIPESLMCPETQVATGDPISHQLSTEGYSNFHRMHRYDTAVPIGGRKGNRLGWATSGWSRQLMLDEFKQAVENGWLIVQSERTLEEMENQEATEDANGALTFDHSSSGHDDSIFGLGIGHFCINDTATMMARLPGVKAPTESEANLRNALPQTCEAIFAHTIMMEERREIEPEEDELNYIF